MLKEGDRVTYVDSERKEHNALVQAIHGDPNDPHPCINLVIISSDEKRTDSYGRQTEHVTSMVHISNNGAEANCWK